MSGLSTSSAREQMVVCGLVLALALGTGACGGDDAPGADGGRDGAIASSDSGHPPPGDGGTPGDDGGTPTDDGGTPTDDGGTPTDDGGTPSDGGDTPSDGGGEPDGCVPPRCPPLRPGCHYEGGGPCSCGTLVCEPTDCGGARCAGTEYCMYETPFSCGGAGTCMDRPMICPDIYAPVCGCDGVTYDNQCNARGAGTDVGADGECGSTTTDCRTAGCAPGESCEPCRGAGGLIYVCLPAGTVC